VEGRNIIVDGEQCRVVSIRDISEKVHAQRSLEESEEKFKSLIKSIPDIVMVFKEHGEVLYANAQLKKQTGFSEKELTIGEKNQLLHPEDYPNFREKVRKILKGNSKSSQVFEHRCLSKDKEVIWYNTVLSPVEFKGEPAVQLVSRNVTDAKTVELDLKKHKEQLEELVKARTEEINKLNHDLLSSNKELTKLNSEMSRQNIDLKALLSQLKSTQRQLIDSEKLASVGKLTAGLAHELNNPINYIGGVLRPLKQDLSELRSMIDDDRAEEIFVEIDELFESIQGGTTKISNIIKTLSEITPKGNMGKVQDIQVSEMVEGNINTLAGRFPEVEFEYEISDDIILHANVLDMQQVFFNVIKNAAEAVQNSAGHVHVKVIPQGDGVKCTVSDDGPGMDDEVQNEIYEPFFTTHQEEKNLGLGLYIVRSVISKYNGAIYVNSRKEQGTIFTFVLPGVIKKGTDS
jgi:PAS domain S-box-containing protein